MAQSDLFRRYLDTTVAIGQMTRKRAEEVVRDFVRAGEVQREQTQQWVDELLERSRKNTEAMADLIGKEVRRQLEASPVVSRTDLARLEKRVNELAAQLNKAAEGPRRAADTLRDRVQGAMARGSAARSTKAASPTKAVSPTKAPAAPKTAPTPKPAVAKSAAPAQSASPAKKAPAPGPAAPASKAPAKKAPAPAKSAPVKKAPEPTKATAKKAAPPAKKAPTKATAPAPPVTPPLGGPSPLV